VVFQGDFGYYETRIPKGLRPTLGPRGTLEENLAHIARVHEETMAAVAGCRPEFFEEERARPDLGFRRKVWVILLGINEHEIHHRAQLSTYLRILGAPVPDVASSYHATPPRPPRS
jgi:hypothetical protein